VLYYCIGVSWLLVISSYMNFSLTWFHIVNLIILVKAEQVMKLLERKRKLGFVNGYMNGIKIKNTFVWDITLCIQLKVNKRFRGTYRLHLQVWRISWARNQRESRWQAELCFLQNVGWYSMEYAALYPRNSIIFITIAVRTSNPMY
jgi:hypothetical protein